MAKKEFPTIPVLLIVIGSAWLLESLLDIDLPVFAIVLIVVGVIWLVNSIVKRK